MRMLTPRFHCPQATPGLARGTRVELPDDAAHHALRVLRLREGHPVSVFCGHGGEYEAVLEAARGKSAQVLLGTFHAADRAPRVDVHVQQSVVATEKMDWVVEKAVELGARRFTPVLAERSGISAEMALRLGALLGNGAQLWLDMQSKYDLWQAHSKLRDVIDRMKPLRSSAVP
jgi:addiction module HigA family antidote